MKAAIFNEPFSMVFTTGRPKPRVSPNEVLVRIITAGVCAGDMYIYLGKNPYAPYPVIGGHELCGIIEELGSRETQFQIGQQVVVEPFLSCGACYPCRIGKRNCCTQLRIIGMHQDGGFAEYLAVPSQNIHPTPPNLPPETACFAEPIAIGLQGCHRAGIKPGEMVLILGCGPIGLALIEVVKHYGGHPFAVDISEPRLDFAKTLGAVTLKSTPDLHQHVLAITNGEGAPVVMEATGNPRVMESTVDLVASGGRIVIMGLTAKGTTIQLPSLEFIRKELTVLGSRASNSCFPEALKLLEGNTMHYPSVATRFDLAQAPEVFEKLHRQPDIVHKAVFSI